MPREPWHPENLAARLPFLRRRQRLAADTRAFLTGRGYQEVETPALVPVPGMEVHLRAFRIKNVVANTSITLEGADTTNTTFFPPGSGAGSVRKVNTFTQITQVTAVSSSGGEPRTVNYKYMESDVEYSINDGFSASQFTLTMDADSIGTAGYTAARNLTEVQSNTIMRMNLRNGSLVLVPCTVALNEAVALNDGQINAVTLAVNSNNRLVRYAS